MTKSLANIKKTCDGYRKLIDDNKQAQKHLVKLIAKLEKTEMESGSPNWKYDKYGNPLLRVVRPRTDTEDRKFIYVGAKSEKIIACFAAIDRHKQYVDLSGKLRFLQYQARQISSTLDGFEYRFLSKLEHIGELTDFSYTLKLQADLTGGAGDMDIDAVRPAKNT